MSADPSRPPNPYEKPAQADHAEPLPPAPGQRKPATQAQRLAGAMMLASGLLVLLETALTPPGAPPDRMGAPRLVSALLDIGIGGSLLAGSSRLVILAIIRSTFGLTVGPLLRLSEGPLGIGIQVLTCAALLGLLIGTAQRVRAAVAGSVLGLLLLVQVVAVASLVTGNNPIAWLLLGAAGDIEASPADRVTGRAAPYELTLPNRKWHLRTPAAAARENSDADLWLVRPDVDAHVMVIAEKLEGALHVEDYTEAILSSVRQRVPDLRVLSREPWPAYPGRGRLLSTSGTSEGARFEWRYAIVTTQEWAYYVMGFATPKGMPAIEAELRSIFDAFKLPDAVLRAVPPDVDATPVTRVAGQHLPYSIAPPGGGWHLRKPDTYQATSAFIDRWLVRPELDAHVLVIAEETPPDTTVELDAFVTEVLKAARSDTTRFDEISRGPWGKLGDHGARVRVSVTRNGVDLEYDYGMYARGNRAVRLVGFAGKAAYPSAKEAIAAVLDSFEPPP